MTTTPDLSRSIAQAGGDDQTARPVQLASLMTQTRYGSQTAFVKLFDATSSWVYGMALAVLVDADEAEDVAREVYLELWRTARRFDASTRDVSAWIEHIAIRHLARRARAVADGTRGGVALDPVI